MISSGSCSLIIRGNKIDFSEIEIYLKVKPTKIVRRDDVLSKSLEPSKYEIWIYEIKYDEGGDPNNTLEKLLSLFNNTSKEFLHRISKIADVFVKCYIQSDLAQIGFEFSPEVIKDLADLGLKLRFSILSWGGIEDK